MFEKIAIPCKDMVLCEKIIPEEKIPENGFYVKEEHVDEYLIVDLGEKFDKKKYPFDIGDHVLVSSTGSEFILEGKKYWLFEPKEIIGKLYLKNLDLNIANWKSIVEENSNVISDK